MTALLYGYCALAVFLAIAAFVTEVSSDGLWLVGVATCVLLPLNLWRKNLL